MENIGDYREYLHEEIIIKNEPFDGDESYDISTAEFVKKEQNECPKFEIVTKDEEVEYPNLNENDPLDIFQNDRGKYNISSFELNCHQKYTNCVLFRFRMAFCKVSFILTIC